MNGNVFDWVWDAYGPYPARQATDPVGAASGTRNVFRGGSFGSPAYECRSAARAWEPAGSRVFGLGFRLVRTMR